MTNLENNFYDELVEIIRKNDCKKLREKLRGKSRDQIKAAECKILDVESHVVKFTSITALHVAAYYDSFESFLEIEDFLKTQEMEEEQILTINSSEGYYPLHYALLNGSYEVSLYILQKMPSQAGKTSDISICPLEFAVIGQESDLLETLFEVNPGTITQEQINNAFNKAIAIGKYPCLKILIDRQDNKKDNSNPTDNTVMRAASSFSPEVVSLVMNHQKEQLTQTFQLRIGEKRVIDCFLSRLITKAKQNTSYKPIIYEALKILDGQNIDITVPNQKGVCHWICYLSDVDIAKYILDHFNVEVNKIDESSSTGAHLLFSDGSKEDNIIQMLKLLIDHHYTIDRIISKDGALSQKTLLERCVTFSPLGKEFLKVTEFLLSKGANPDAPLYKPTKDMKTIRDYVGKRKSKAMKELFARYPPKQ